jgi:hypothetical protein
MVAASAGSTLLGFLIIFGLYFLPTIVAIARKVPNMGVVIVINFFLGWTVIGWIVALAMAVRSKPKWTAYQAGYSTLPGQAPMWPPPEGSTPAQAEAQRPAQPPDLPPPPVVPPPVVPLPVVPAALDEPPPAAGPAPPSAPPAPPPQPPVHMPPPIHMPPPPHPPIKPHWPDPPPPVDPQADDDPPSPGEPSG